MKERGRKDIVAVLGPQDNPAVVDRLRGYRAVLGEDLPDANVIYTGWNSGDGYQPCARSSRARLLSMACSADRTVSRLASSPHSTRQAYLFRRKFLSSLRRSRDCDALRPRTHDRPPAPARRRPHGRQHCARHDQGCRAHHHRHAHAARSERLAVGTGPASARQLLWKARSVLSAHSGAQFPLDSSTGNCVPLFCRILGRAFPEGPPLGKRDPFWTQIPGRTFRDARSSHALTISAHKKRGKARVLPSLRAICSRSLTSGAG